MKKLPMTIAVLAGCSMLAGMLPQAWSDPGDIIITRQVSPRTAFRPGTGPVMAKSNPGQQVQSALGLDQYSGGSVAQELTNGEISNVASGMPIQSGIGAAHSAGIVSTQNSVIAGAGEYGLAAGSMMTGSMGGGAGGTAGSMAQQAAGQVMGALKGIGLIGR
jgi:hypothetical protein